MKTIRNVLAAFILLLSLPAMAQTDKTTTATIVENQDFIFVASTAQPLNSQDISAVLRGMNAPNSSGTINLTGSQYELVIKKDSVVVNLPYYGRSYSPSPDPADSGIKFKSKDFKYKQSKNKKGGWRIEIEPKDVKDNQRLSLSITENGYASLYVLNNNRQPITFNGYLSTPRVK